MTVYIITCSLALKWDWHIYRSIASKVVLKKTMEIIYKCWRMIMRTLLKKSGTIFKIRSFLIPKNSYFCTQITNKNNRNWCHAGTQLLISKILNLGRVETKRNVFRLVGNMQSKGNFIFESEECQSDTIALLLASSSIKVSTRQSSTLKEQKLRQN